MTAGRPRGVVEGAKREALLTSLTSFYREFGYPPTVRLLGKMVGLNSPSSVHRHLQLLVTDGRVRQLPGHRGYVPAQP